MNAASRRKLQLAACLVLATVALPGARAAQVTVSVNATVVEVQCTAQQRTRIRACAAAQETYALEPGKRMVAQRPVAGEPVSIEARHEIRLDHTRPVLVRTVLY